MNQKIVLAQNKKVYTDYESVASSINWCTPTFLNCGVCINASANAGIVKLELTLNTPFGSYSKTFNFDSNICFNWDLPVMLSPGIEVCIEDLDTDQGVMFTLVLGLCVKLPFLGKKCIAWSQPFNIPLLGDSRLATEQIKAEDLKMLYMLLAPAAGNTGKECNCH